MQSPHVPLHERGVVDEELGGLLLRKRDDEVDGGVGVPLLEVLFTVVGGGMAWWWW